MVTWAVDLRGDKGASRLGRFLDRISIPADILGEVVYGLCTVYALSLEEIMTAVYKWRL